MESHVDRDLTFWMSEELRGFYDRIWRKPDTPRTVLCAQDDFDFTLPIAQGPVLREKMGCTFLVMTKPSDPFWLMLTMPAGKGAMHEKVFSHLPQRLCHIQPAHFSPGSRKVRQNLCEKAGPRFFARTSRT